MELGFKPTEYYKEITALNPTEASQSPGEGIKGYDATKWNPVRKFFAKLTGVFRKDDEGKVIYLNKASLRKFIDENFKQEKKPVSNKEYLNVLNEKIGNLKKLTYMRNLSEFSNAFGKDTFVIAKDSFGSILKGLGMREEDIATLHNTIAAYQDESKTMYNFDKINFNGSCVLGLIEKNCPGNDMLTKVISNIDNWMKTGAQSVEGPRLKANLREKA